MTQYLVTWAIDIEANSPEEAAEEALAIHRDPDSEATVFDVTQQSTGETVRIDVTLEGTKCQVDYATKDYVDNHPMLVPMDLKESETNKPEDSE